MAGLVNPKNAPEESAYALLIELIRAQKVPVCSADNIDELLSIYDRAVQHFKTEERADTKRQPT